ncbi:MAG: 4a-hydroxytetrahydrobiopterin dehydratase [Candidatus Baltobacteraceae bacterium]|jgi:4a-hydroxytetrahydrobiopterin dehydratase
MTVHGHEQIEARLAKLPGWRHLPNSIEKVFDRGDFDGSLRFVNEVARLANEQNHHPDIAVSWNRVTLTLSSHDAGGLTERDFKLAEAIEALGA